MKMLAMQAKLTLANIQTDITKLIVVFRNFVNAPKKAYKILRSKRFGITFSMSIVASMVRVNKEQATTNYFKNIVNKTK
jgi:hypothetical protein